MRPITRFVGEYYCFSNFFPARVLFEGIEYPTSEHAFQAAKTLDHVRRYSIARLPTPRSAKREGRLVMLRSDWEEVKVPIMEAILRDKFTRHSRLHWVLLSTRDRPLIEGNTWGDREWGVVDGVGENKLGKALMKIRDEFRFCKVATPCT